MLLLPPQISGAASTTVISGVVNFTSGLDGLGATATQPINISVPLDPTLYNDQQAVACLRLEVSQGTWLSDGISLVGISASGVATCALTSLDNNQAGLRVLASVSACCLLFVGGRENCCCSCFAVEGVGLGEECLPHW